MHAATGWTVAVKDSDRSALYGATGWTVVATDNHDFTFFLQVRTGIWAVSNVWYSRLWDELELGTDLATAITRTAAREHVDPEWLREQIARDLPELTRRGFFSRRPPSPPPRWLAEIVGDDVQPERRISVDVAERPSRPIAAAGAVALVFGFLVTPLPFWLRLRVLVAIRRRRPQRPALPQTERAAVAVKRAARWCRPPAECLTQSIATFFAGAILGAPADWCIGARIVLSPDGWVLDAEAPQHAWVEAGGVAIDYAAQDRRCLTMLRV